MPSSFDSYAVAPVNYLYQFPHGVRDSDFREKNSNGSNTLRALIVEIQLVFGKLRANLVLMESSANPS